VEEESGGDMVLTIVAVVLMVAFVSLFAVLIYKERKREAVENQRKAKKASQRPAAPKQ
jgi:uncharacterized membrane protein YqiK